MHLHTRRNSPVVLLAVIIAGGLLLTSCSQTIVSTAGPSMTVSAAAQPVAPATIDAHVTSSDRLPVAVAELNRSQLQLIAFAKATPMDPLAVDAGLRAVAAHATEVGLLGSGLSATMAAQTAGQANAESYAAIARTGFALALEAQNLRALAATNPAQVVTVIADYGSRLWNPTVTAEGSTANPFIVHVADQSTVEPVQRLEGDAVSQFTSQLNEDQELRTWVAISTKSTTRTLDVPADATAVVNPFDPAALKALITSDGQKDGDIATQVIGAHLDLLVSDTPAGSSYNFLIPSADAAGPRKTKKKTVSMPTGIIPFDLYNLGKQNSSTINAIGNKFIPILVNEMKGLATTAKNAAVENTVKAAEPEVADFLKGAGIAIPTKKNTVPVTNSTAPVAITITLDEAVDVSAEEAQKRGYNDGEKAVAFTVSWNTVNTSEFTISCNGRPVADSNQAQVSLNWPFQLGAQRIACVALGKGGAVLGSSAVMVTLRETNTSSSKGIGLSVASASAPATASSASSAAAAQSSVASSKSASASSAAAAASSAAASSTATASSAATASSIAGSNTGWIEGYIKATENDLLARGYEEIAVAIVVEDLRTCLFDEANKGKNESDAKKACAVKLKDQAKSSSPADPTDQPLPTVGASTTMTETITGGPKTTFSTQIALTGNFKAKSVDGSLLGTASWEDDYWCYNTEDKSEIYETISVRYTSTYTAKVYGGLQESGTYSIPLEVGGSTSAKPLQKFTHEKCTHLNTAGGVVDTFTGKGTITGTATMGSMWTITTHWVTDDGVVTVGGTAAVSGWVK